MPTRAAGSSSTHSRRSRTATTYPSSRARPTSRGSRSATCSRTRGIAGLVAERAGDVVGCAFVDERAVIAGIGPVDVDPEAQDDSVGRALMEAVLRRELGRGVVGIRLVQTAYHYRSLALSQSSGSAFASRCRSCRAARRPPPFRASVSGPPATPTSQPAATSACVSTGTTATASCGTPSPPAAPRSSSARTDLRLRHGVRLRLARGGRDQRGPDRAARLGGGVRGPRRDRPLAQHGAPRLVPRPRAADRPAVDPHDNRALQRAGRRWLPSIAY